MLSGTVAAPANGCGLTNAHSLASRKRLRNPQTIAGTVAKNKCAKMLYNRPNCLYFYTIDSTNQQFNIFAKTYHEGKYECCRNERYR